MEFLKEIWSFFLVEANQNAVSSIIAVLGFFGAGAAGVWAFTTGRLNKALGISGDASDVPREQHETMRRDKTETIEAKNDLIAALQLQIRQREEQIKNIRADDARRHEAEIEGLKAEIAVLKARLEDPERAEREFEEVEDNAVAALEREANQLDQDRVREAKEAMDARDFTKADALFEEIEEREALAVQSAARAAYARGEIAEAEVRWSDAARHYARAAGLNETFDTLFKAREFAWRAGQLESALDLGDRLVALVESDPEVAPEQRATALNEHALTLKATGRYEEAEPLYREALEIDRKALGEDHPGYATDLNNLAGLLEDTGRYEEAEPLYREALEITRKALGEAHPNYASGLNNLALLLRATGRSEEAEPLFREALEISRKTLGEAHPDYATDLNNLAGLLQDTGRHEEAEPLFREALEITRKALGEAHPDYAQSVNNLAVLYAYRERFDEALPLMEQALAIREAALGPEHPNTLSSQRSLAAMRAAAGVE